MKIKIPYFAFELIKRLRDSGFEAYAVGGAVRDCLLKKKPTDWDVTTNAAPDEVIKIFKDKKTIPTGIKHGTVTVLNKGASVEITTFRTEKGYKDFRHPDNVKFVSSLDEDLKRRDFTVNALCIFPDGSIVDKFGGMKDLKNKTLRAIGDPQKRFKEDALRILRAVRFCSCYGFKMEENTKKAVFDNVKLLEKVSPERCMTELIKLLRGKFVHDALMEYKEVIFTIIPELRLEDGVFQRQDFHAYDVWEHTVYSVQNIEDIDYLKFTMLLHDVGKPACADGMGHFKGHAYVGAEICETILPRLHVSARLKNKVVKLVRLHNMVAENSDKSLKKLIFRYGSDTVIDLVKIFRADSSAKRKEIAETRCKYYDEMEASLFKLLKEEPVLSMKDLKIKGQDIIALGVPKGPMVGKVLRKVSWRAYETGIPNEKEELLHLAEKIIKEI